MANVVRFNAQALQKIRDTAGKSLYYFSRGLMRAEDMTPELHLRVCNWLQFPKVNPVRRCLCVHRGSMKSECIICYIWWRGLYEIDWSALLVMQKYDLAKAHMERLQRKFLIGPMAAFLQDMYADRLEGSIEKWTTERTLLRRHDANAEPFLTLGSLDGRLESVHRKAVIGDDLEGADADKSDVPNEASEDFVYQRAEPLLINPSQHEILVTGTPHGSAPLVHKLRRDPTFDTFWQPVLDEHGKPAWPERFSPEWCAAKQKAAQLSSKARRMWDMQYMLRESSVGSGLFDMTKIEENFYEISGGRLVHYVADGEKTQADLGHCRFFIHGDPGHKSPEERVTTGDVLSLWAWVVVAVAPDFHVFVVETWAKHCGLDEYIDAFFKLYAKWAPYKWTFEGEGAQSWLKSHLKLYERTKHRRLMSRVRPWSGRQRRLPAPSSRLVEVAYKRTKKEEHIIEALELWHNAGWLHLHPSHEELVTEHRVFPSESHPMDVIDALSQGPQAWEPPLSEESRLARIKREARLRVLRTVEPLTGYSRPWADVA